MRKRRGLLFCSVAFLCASLLFNGPLPAAAEAVEQAPPSSAAEVESAPVEPVDLEPMVAPESASLVESGPASGASGPGLLPGIELEGGGLEPDVPVEGWTETAHWYPNPDGAGRVFDGYVGREFYQRADGSWERVDRSLVAAGGTLLKVRSDSQDLFLDSALLTASVETAAGPVVMTHLGITNVVTDLAPDALSLAGLNAWPDGRDLVLAPVRNGVKDSVVLPGPEAAGEYLVQLALPVGVTARDGNSGVELEKDGAVVATYFHGLAVDSAPAPQEAGVRVSLVEQLGPLATVRVAVSSNWLDAPERVFPVLIDPTFSPTTAASGAADAYYNSDNCTSPFPTDAEANPSDLYIVQPLLRVGSPGRKQEACGDPNDGSAAQTSQWSRTRAFFRWNVSSAPYYGREMSVSSATVELFANSEPTGSTGARTYQLRDLSTGFDSSTSWSTQPRHASYSTQTSVSPDTLGTWSVATLADRWLQAGSNRGVGVYANAAGSASEYSTSYWVSFSASESVGNDPRLRVTYIAAPNVPRNIIATAAPGAADVRWDAPSDDGGDAVSGYKVWARDLGNNNETTPFTVGAADRTARVNGLTSGRTYRIYIRAINDAGEGGSGTSNQVSPAGVLELVKRAVGTSAGTASCALAPASLYQLGDVAGYCLQVKNLSGTTQTVFMRDTLPGGVSLIASSLMLDGVACGATCSVTSRSFALGIPVAAGATRTMTYAVDVDNVSRCAMLVNSAVADVGLDTEVTSSASVPVCGSGLGIEDWWTFVDRDLGPEASARVNVANGNLVVSQLDSTPIRARGDLALALRRTYNSQDPTLAALASPIGKGWTLNTTEAGALGGVSATGLSVSGDSFANPLALTLVDRDGSHHRFEPRGLSVRLPIAGLGVTPPTGMLATLVPRVLTQPSTPLTNLCVDQRYEAPPGVHLSVWRYVAVQALPTDPCTPLPTTQPAVVGYATMRSDRLRQEFFATGQLLDLIDANGVALRYTYDNAPAAGAALGRLRAITETSGCSTTCRAITFTYSPAAECPAPAVGTATCARDAAGRVTRYELDGGGRLVLVRNPDPQSTSWRYGYDTPCGTGRLCTVTDLRGNTTDFTYATTGSVTYLTELADRRGSTTTFDYGNDTTIVTRGDDREQFESINGAGQVGVARAGSHANGTSAWLRLATFSWDDGCVQPGTKVDNNLCTVTRDSLSNDTPDGTTNYLYNPEGAVLREQRKSASTTLNTTFGYRNQFVATARTVVDDRVAGSGTVTSGTRPTGVVYHLADPLETLSSRGNTVGASFQNYLVSYAPEIADAMPNQPQGAGFVSCANPAAPTANTGNVCTTTGRAHDGSRPVTAYTYDRHGAQLTMLTPKAAGEGHSDKPYRYTYFADAATDMTTTVSTGGWLEKVTDPTGATVRFAYDRAGNVVRTWDRNNSAAGDLNYTESVYGSWSAPWRYLTSSRDALGNLTTFTRDAHGNPLTTRPPRGNVAANDNYDVIQTFDPHDNVVSKLSAENRARGANAWTWTYTDRDLVETETDPEGGVRVLRYDAVGRLRETAATRGPSGTYVSDGCVANSGPEHAPIPAGKVFCFTTTTYDGHDNPTAVTDAARQTTTAKFDGLGRRTEIQTPTGAVSRAEYDPDSNPLRVCKPRQAKPVAEGGGGTTSGCPATAKFAQHLGYYPSGKLATASTYRATSSSTANTWTYRYDLDGNLRETVSPRGGITTTATFDLLGRKSTETVPRSATQSNTTTWHYDAVGNITAIAAPQSRTTAFGYDDNNRPTLTVAAANSLVAGSAGPTNEATGTNLRTQTDYDVEGRVVAVFEPRAFATGTSADPRFATRFAYDRDGRQVSVRSPRYDTADPNFANPSNGSTTQASHCPTGSPDYPSTVGVCTTTTSYDDAGRPDATTDAAGTELRPRYLEDNLVAAVNVPSPANPQTRIDALVFTHDGAGRERTRTDALNHTTAISYYADGRVQQVERPTSGTLTHKTTYAYDADGNPTTATDVMNPSTTFDDQITTAAYFADGLLDSVTEPGGFKTSYVYDEVGNPTQVKSPAANATASATQDNNTANIPTVNTYTRDNLLETSTVPFSNDGARRRRTTYAYDNAGRKTSQVLGHIDCTTPSSVTCDTFTTPSGGTMAAQTFTYQANDRLATENGRKGEVITRSYDASGHLRAVTDSSVTPNATVTASYYLDGLLRTSGDGAWTSTSAYDGVGRPAARVDDTGSSQHTTRYGWNTAGMPTTVDAPSGGGTTTTTFDVAGRPDLRALPNGLTVDWQWNDDDTLRQQDLRTSAGTSRAKWDYTYDELFRVKTETFASASATLPFENSRTFTYVNNRLTSAGSNESYTWDLNGNRISKDINGDDVTYAYNADDSLKSHTSSWGTGTFTYDPAGALIAEWCRDNTYDGFDRLTASTKTTRSNCTVGENALYEYDGLDRQRRVREGTGDRTQRYLGLDQALLGETIASASPTLYTFAGDDAPLAVSTLSGSPAVEQLTDNGRGDQTTTTDSAGNLKCSMRFEAFGDPMSPQNEATNPCATSGSTASKLAFAGGRRDSATTNYQFGSRTYNPTKAAWLTPDNFRNNHSAANLSIGVDPLTRNSYSYVNGDPINLRDPDGHAPVCVDYACNPTQLAADSKPYVKRMAIRSEGRTYFLTPQDAARANAEAGGSKRCTLGPRGEVTNWYASEGTCGVMVKAHSRGLMQRLANGLGGVLNAVSFGNAKTLLSITGSEGKVDYSSSEFRTAEIATTVVDVALGIGAVVKGVRAGVNGLRAARTARAARATLSQADGAVSLARAPRSVADDLAGAACSFSAATTVVMADGTRRAISEIEVGDLVLAEDPETGERGPRRVTHVWEHDDTVVDLEIDGDVVTTTEDHPFWNATDSEWQQAQDLDAGDVVRTADGELVEVGGLRLRTARTTTAFNLTVDGIHTYFVGVGEDDVLVHNTCGGTHWNPFKGKSAAEIDEMFRAKGFEPRGPDPVSGYGGYVNPRTGRSYHIDPPEFGRWSEPFHVDVNRPRGSSLPKRKYYTEDQG